MLLVIFHSFTEKPPQTDLYAKFDTAVRPCLADVTNVWAFG